MSKTKQDRSKEGRAVVKYLRISPRKVRLVINTIRHKPAVNAFGVLRSLKKKAARLTEQALKSAVASAKGKGLDEARLVVSEIKADGGPFFKRFMARAMGRADQMLKRTTHLTVVLREGERSFGPPTAPEEGKKAKQEKPKKEKKAARAKEAKAAAQAA